jgi:hypothetical protein
MPGAVARYAPAALVAALLLATGLAFLYTESLKLETSPIRQTRVTKLFSPTCRCGTSKARIAFRVAKPDVVSVSIQDGSGTDVRQLVYERPSRGRVAFLWNGKDDAGNVVEDGIYRARVRLDLIEKTYTLPNAILVDTSSPTLHVTSVTPRVFSPDGDRRSDRVTVGYRVDQRARAMLYVDGRRRVVGASLLPSGELRWYGVVDGKPLPAGRYRLSVAAVDLAGNRSPTVAAGSVAIRYVEIVAVTARVKPGGTIRVRVSTDARRVTWRMGKRSGRATPPVFSVRAPTAKGGHILVVEANGHRAGVRVVVVGQ